MRGKLLTGIQDETGLKTATPVFAVGAHDTASAVASIPVKDENFAFISSGTWSLIGIIADRAILGDEVYNQQFSNEGTVDGRYRLLRNIMGLWIIQNCRQEWEREGRVSWDDIVELAGKAPPFGSFINVNEHQFYTADNMIQKICRYCEETGQHVPQTIGEIARAVYESLAMSYREAFKGLEMIKGARINVMHIVGGGSQNKLLNQMTANAIGRHLIAGPTEATAIGNLMVQIKASGEVKDWSEMRQVICDSFEVETYKPHDTDAWAEHFEGYTKIKSLNKGQ
jgi:rhamnulokinase